MATISYGMLHVAARQLTNALEDTSVFTVGEMKKDLAERIRNNVIGHAAASAASAIAAGFLPGAGALVAFGISVGAIWAMYIKICSLCGISFKKDLLKALASAVLSNIVTQLAGIIVLDVVVSIIPGAASVVGAFMNFLVVYAAGIVFINLLTGFFKAKGSNIENMSEADLKEAAKKAADDLNMKKVKDEAKSVFDQMKKDGSLKNADKEYNIHPEEE